MNEFAGVNSWHINVPLVRAGESPAVISPLASTWSLKTPNHPIREVKVFVGESLASRKNL
jgi:hypothetical protein